MKDLPKGEILFDVKSKFKRSKNILAELDDFEEEESFLPSVGLAKSKENKKAKKEEKKRKVESDPHANVEMVVDEDNEWLTTLTSFKVPKAKKKKMSPFDQFGGKKKKKKDGEKKHKGGAISHKKDFDTELILLRNLQMDQSKFTDSLQKKYDQMENTKSTSRGVGKFTTDLIMSITSARSLNMQLVDKIIATKKTIADLDFKERKEFGSQNNGEATNLSNYASTYLKQILNTGRDSVVQKDYYDGIPESDGDMDDLFDGITESLSEPDSDGNTYSRSSDAEKYLKYENDDIKIRVYWHDDVKSDDPEDQYDFIAFNREGDIIDDYPLPKKTKMNLNRSTGQCTDMYGQKYELIID